MSTSDSSRELMTSNGDYVHSPPSTPSPQGGMDFGNDDGVDYIGEDHTPSASADDVGIANSGNDDGFNLKSSSSEAVPFSGSRGSQSQKSGNEERLANLIELNNTLVQKVSALRTDKESLNEKLKSLEEQLRIVRANQAAEAQDALQTLESVKKDLLDEKAKVDFELQSSIDERQKLETQATEVRQFIDGLQRDFAALLTEKIFLEQTNRVFESKAKDALDALEGLRGQHNGVLEEKNELEQSKIELEMERRALETEVSQVTNNLDQMRRVHNELVQEQRDLERERREAEEKFATYVAKVDELKGVIKDLEAKNEEFSLRHQDLLSQKIASEEVQGAWESENASLLQRIRDLSEEKTQLTQTLRESEQQLATTVAALKQSEQALATASATVTELKEEVDTLHHLHMELSRDHGNLQIQQGHAEAEGKRMISLNVELEDQLTTMSDTLKAADEALEEANRSVDVLQCDLGRENQQKQRVESMLAEVTVQLQQVRKDKEEVQARVHYLEERVGDLEEELSAAVTETNKAIRRAEREAESSEALRREVGTLHGVKEALEDELMATKSCLDATQKDLTSTKDSLSEMENQLTEYRKERESLRGVKAALELEIRRMSGSSAETADKVEEELRMWREKVEELAESLEKARTAAGSNEKKTWEVMSELQGLKSVLQRRSRWSKVCYPAAVVSGAAALAVGYTVIKYKVKPQ